MAAYGLYLLKVSICIMVFYCFYLLMLRKCTFFYLNRSYLIFSTLASFVIPVLNISIFENQSDHILSALIHPVWVEPEYELIQLQNVSNHATTDSSMLILTILYFTGLSILFFKLLFSAKRIIRIRKNSTIDKIGKTRVIRTNSILPFSFFNMVFLPKDEDDQLIISHEMAHVKQYHWVDLVFLELVSMLLWFNPFIFFIKKSLKLQHEYLADAQAANGKEYLEKYLYSMLKQVQIVSYGGITSQFYCKTIKKRITMITKNKTSNKYLAVYLLMLPLVCLMLLAFSENKVLAQNMNALDSIHSDNTTALNDLAEPSIYPIESEKIKRISGYGERVNPKTKQKQFHYGIDFSISEGENVVSTADGVVVEAQFDSKKGNYAIIQHNEVFSTFYSHLKSISVQPGEKLKKGQIIGYSGNTGLSTGPHLHYEVFKNGKNADPKDYLP